MDIFESLENLNVSEKCFKNITELVENYINELNDGTYRRMRDIAKALVDEQEKVLPTIKKEKDRKCVEKDIVKRKRQALKAENKYENQVTERAKKKYEDSRKNEN